MTLLRVLGTLSSLVSNLDKVKSAYCDHGCGVISLDDYGGGSPVFEEQQKVGNINSWKFGPRETVHGTVLGRGPKRCLVVTSLA